jgi:hypothetical protein
MLETFKLIKSETLPLTLKLAEHFRDLDPSPTEREMSPARIKYLTEKAEAGLLVSPTWATARLGDKLLRVNGQHSSNVLCNLNGSFPEGLQVHIDSYQVDDEAGLALLFRQFDDRKSGRSTSDVAGAYQGLQENLRSIPKSTAKLGVDGVVWWRRNVEGTPVSSGDGAYEIFAVTEVHPFLLWLGEIFTIKTPELRRPPIVAAMYASFQASETNAKTFWFEVARGGVEYRDDHPTTVLDAWLKSLREAKEVNTRMKPANFYQGCIYAWNAYRDDKTLATIKSDVKKGLLKAAE